MPAQVQAALEVRKSQEPNGNEILTIVVHGELRDKAWSEHFGYVKQEVLNAPSTCLIELDLSATTWMDPLPTLSLAILLYQRFDATEQNPNVIVGRGHRDLQSIDHWRTLKFLASQGFINIFEKCCKLFWGDRLITETKNMIKYLINIKNAPLRYIMPDCIAAEVINLNDKTKLESIVQTCVRNAQDMAINSFFSKAPIIRDQTLHILHGILTELFLNIHEHAYPGTPNKYAGIYARIRHSKDF